MTHRLAAAWIIRGLLAALLLTGSVALLWPDPPAFDALDWLAHIVGALALAALLLDLRARWQVRDLFGLLLLAGLYGLAVTWLLDSRAPDAGVFYSLVTLALGAHTLAGLAALGLMRWPPGAPLPRLLPLAVLIGLVWGVWVRWGPVDPGPALLLALAAPLLALAVGLGALAGRAPGDVDLRLTLAEWLVVLLALAGLISLRVGRAPLDEIAALVTLLLLACCWLMLWFQAGRRAPLALNPAPARALALLAAVLLAGGALGHSLPFAPGGQQRALIIVLFTVGGLVWLPTVSLVLGVRGYRRQSRQRRL